MEVYKNIIILGTSHIAQSSIKAVKEAFTDKPNIVAVELDPARLHALLSNQPATPQLKNIAHFGVKGFLFAVVGYFVQQKLGSIVGVKPGSDMMAAVKEARKNQIPLALIDRPIQVTLKRLSKTITWKEKWNFFIDLVKSPFAKKIKINLAEVPEEALVKDLMKQLKKRYPNLYNVLVAERNKYMAKKLYIISKKESDKKILAVLGAGHVEDIMKLVKNHYTSNKIEMV